MRPILRPGLQVLRRDLRTLQLGLDWPGTGTLADTPAVRAVLGSVDGVRDLAAVAAAAVDLGAAVEAVQEAIDLLLDCGVLVDQAANCRGPYDESSWAALSLLACPGHSASDLAAHAAAVPVLVVGAGQVAETTARLIGEARVPLTTRIEEAELVVYASQVEPPRELADDALRHGVTHLWARVRECVGLVGPFVVPGRTPCLRCVDASLHDRDPAWHTLLLSAEARPMTTPACHPLLAETVAALAAQDAAAWAWGLRPQSWCRVLELPLGFGELGVQEFEPHPHCGCGWSAWRETIGA
ncbi:MAG TPA: hypothetical protein VFI30_01740 [Nocardioidaceae bacterium]|nr:hypothetical protein [Nocardioidaceae bacterium]